jgi:hypothetical protein
MNHNIDYINTQIKGKKREKVYRVNKLLSFQIIELIK